MYCVSTTDLFRFHDFFKIFDLRFGRICGKNGRIFGRIFGRMGRIFGRIFVMFSGLHTVYILKGTSCGTYSVCPTP